MSNNDCHTTWRQDFLGTSVMYTVLTGEKMCFLVAPTQSNFELFNQYNSQETDAQILDLISLRNISLYIADFHYVRYVLGYQTN